MVFKIKDRFKEKKSGQEMVEWWFIITAISFVVMFTLLKWGDIQQEVMTKLNGALNNVHTNISTTG